MVTTSFTLRKTSSGFGSYTRKNANDTSLRSDNFITQTNSITGVNTFSANIINYSNVLLSWSLSFNLTPIDADPAPADPAPVEILIIASSTGEPQTIKDGAVVFTTLSNTVSSYSDGIRVEKGRWVYYSLFARYSDFEEEPTFWYERLTSLYVQIPKEYNSVNNLWARIPEYYRTLDASQEGQPLYNFIELFGWEMDRLRTLVDTVALSNDPDLAVTPALAELAYQMGLETTVEAVGSSRVRKLLDGIGRVRRSKGTLESVQYYLDALTGCVTTYETLLVDSTLKHIFKVHSQRVNFCADPTFNQAVTTNQTGTGATYRTSITSSSTWGVYSYGGTSTTGASVTTNGKELTVSNVGTGTITALVYQRTSFPYYPAADLYTNFTPTSLGGASFTNFHIASSSVMTAWESGVSSGSVPPSLYYDTWNTEKQELKVNDLYPSEKRYVLNSNSTSESTINVVPVLTFSIPAGQSFTLKNWLVESFYSGEYFDGDTKEGGYLPTLAGNGIGTYDYRWAGTQRASFSYYMLDYKRISDITENIIKNYIAPVTVKDDVQLNWNYYYGKT
jgi:hypothetical protein